ncbi:hypothetical protein GCM10023147_45350 [Tsukamurella soli]|uniref:RiboL-PSP-HEPN domain-containing protein n=1 Tax=Tsukamurella soli TaxID=644556 RepID=A0ABP8KBR6_9ACTN
MATALSHRLYLWNIRIGAALQEVLVFVEVSLRNSLDRALGEWNPTRGSNPRTGVLYSADWTLDAAPPLRGRIAPALAQAHVLADRVRSTREPGHPRKGEPVRHDDVVAQLSFGVWARLLRPAGRADGVDPLWSAALRHAFSPVARDSVAVQRAMHDRVDRLVRLRHRVAHAGSLLDVNVEARLTDAFDILRAISQPAENWCAAMSRVHDLDESRPR